MLKLENINVGYNQKIIASNINLELYPGKKILVSGEPQCGKTTVLKTAAGFIKPISGDIQFIPEQEKICYVPQDILPGEKTNIITKAMLKGFEYIIADEPFAFLSDAESFAMYNLLKSYEGGLLISETFAIYRKGFDFFIPTYKKTALSKENAVYN